MLEIFLVIALVWLGCAFPGCLVDAIQATDEKKKQEARYSAGACFGAILLLLVLILN